MAFAVSQTKLKSVTHLAILVILYMDIISLSTHIHLPSVHYQIIEKVDGVF